MTSKDGKKKAKIKVEDGARKAPPEPAETHEMTEEEMIEAAKRPVQEPETGAAADGGSEKAE